MNLGPDLKSLYEEELKQLMPPAPEHPLLEGISFDRKDYFFDDEPRPHDEPERKSATNTQRLSYTHFIESGPEASQLKEDLIDITQVKEDTARQTAIKKWIYKHIIRHMPFPTNREERSYYSDEFLAILGKYLDQISKGTCKKLIREDYPAMKDPRLFKGRIIEIDPATSTLSYYINDKEVLAWGAKRPHWSAKIENPKDELTQAEAYWNLALQFLYDPELQTDHAQMILQAVFPNHRLDEVIEELKNQDSPLHNLSPEQLFLVITRPELAFHGVYKTRQQEASKRTGKDLKLPWSSCTEVAEKLITHVLRRAFRDRIVEVTAFHPESYCLKSRTTTFPKHVREEIQRGKRGKPGTITKRPKEPHGLKEIAEEKRAAGQEFYDYSQRSFLIKPFLDRPILTEDEEQALREAPEQANIIGDLHRTLLAIEECFTCAKDMKKIAEGTNKDWMDASQQYIALGRTLLRALPDYIRQIEYSFIHPTVKIEIEAVAKMIDSLLLNDFSTPPDISKQLEDLHGRGEAVKEVLALTGRSK
jgi:hypothetical protein